ncbi:MAG: hypothetical protein ABJE09_04625 [Roseobacter sp.]
MNRDLITLHAFSNKSIYESAFPERVIAINIIIEIDMMFNEVPRDDKYIIEEVRLHAD